MSAARTCDGDDCDRRVSTRGFLGGELICPECARTRREEFEA